MDPLVHLVAVSAVVMCLAHTIAREKIGEPLRRRLGGKETWAGYLVSCPYCVSHWIAFLVVPLCGAEVVHVAPRWPVVSPLLDWFLSCILVVAIAAFLRVTFYFVDETQGLVRRRQRLVDEEVHEVEERARDR